MSKFGSEAGGRPPDALVGVFAVCAFAAVVAVCALAGGEPPQPGTAQPGAGGALVAVVGALAFSAWGVSAVYRCIGRMAQRIAGAMAFALLLLMCGAGILDAVWGTGGLPVSVAALAGGGVAVLVFELCLALGVVLSNHDYVRFFWQLPLDVKVLNDVGRPIFQTDRARPVDSVSLWRIARSTRGAEVGAVIALSLDGVPDRSFRVYRLNGGVALLAGDTRESARLQARLRERQGLLSSQNEVLRSSHSMQRLVFRQQRERELYQRVERDLASTAEQIRRILDGRTTGDSPEARKERTEQLNLVKVLVAYSKRKGMLALAAAESDTMTGDQLDLIMREAMADLHSIGIESAALVRASAPIPVSAVNTVYDSFYDCIIGVLPRANPVVMTFITAEQGQPLQMRVAIECAIGLSEGDPQGLIPKKATSFEPWTYVQMLIAHELEGRLATRGGDYSVSMEEGVVNVLVRAVDEGSL